MASCAPRTSRALIPTIIEASSSSTTFAAAAAPYVQPIPVSSPAAASTSARVVWSQSSVPSDSWASVGTTKTEARTSASGVSMRSRTAVIRSASGLDRVEHLPDRVADHLPAARIAVEDGAGEVPGLLEGDVRRQRRNLRIGDHLEHRRAVGAEHLVPGIGDAVGIGDAHALEADQLRVPCIREVRNG